MKDLTRKQQAIWDLKEQGLTRPEIATELGVGKQHVSNTITVIRKKLGVAEGRKNRQELHSVECLRPEIAAAAIEAAADPLLKTQKAAIEKVNAELEAAGLPAKVNQALVRRMMVKYANAITVKKAASTKEIIDGLEKNICLIDSYIDDKVCAEANLRDLGLVKSALIEKRNLLRGEPTTIISDAERAKLTDLLPVLIEEGKRRGIIIEGTAIRK